MIKLVFLTLCFAIALDGAARGEPKYVSRFPTKGATLAVNWDLSARMDQARYVSGKEITLVLGLKNKSAGSLGIFRGDALFDYMITVRRGEKEIPFSRRAIMEAINGGAKSKHVDSGRELQETIKLNEVLEQGNTLEPGDYEVSVTRTFESRFSEERGKSENRLAAKTKFTVVK